MHRSKRQLAKVRESQTTPPLTPSMYHDAPAPTPTPTAAEIAAAREERIETAIRRDAVVFGLKSELAFEERERVKERHEKEAQYARLLSRIERLEQDASAMWAKYSSRWAEEATKHKAYLLDLVRSGEFCKNAAARPEDIVAEIEKKEIEKCQTTNQ